MENIITSNTVQNDKKRILVRCIVETILTLLSNQSSITLTDTLILHTAEEVEFLHS